MFFRAKVQYLKSRRLQLIIIKDKDGKIDNDALRKAFEVFKEGESS